MASNNSEVDSEATELTFDPREAVKKGQEREVTWVYHDGAPNGQEDVSTPNEVMADVEHVLKGNDGNLKALSFRNPATFKAGELESHADLWEIILDGYKDKANVMKWVRSGVDIKKFFQYFEGEFNGERFNSPYPRRKKIPNHESCSEQARFVTATLKENLKSGAFRVWGKVGEVKPPWLVLPMKVEPTKPRLVIDARYLNLWMKDNPKSFSLESLDVVPDFVYKNSFMTKIDDKSAYHHILLSRNSQEYFGIKWEGWWLVCTSLPFGWKNAPYVYQTVGLGATHFFRSRGIACSLYIDDRLNEELFTKEGRWSTPMAQRNLEFSLQAAKAAVYVICKILVNLGYFLGLQKCVFEPSTSIVHLGMLIDSTTQSFSVPQGKKVKFKKLREEILESESFATRQSQLKKLRGKCLSFSNAFPLANFYVREITKATNDRPQASLSQGLREELEFWGFLDDFNGVISWRRDKTIRVSLSISPLQWEAIIHLPSGEQSSLNREFEREQPTAVLGIQALELVLKELPSDLSDCEVEIAVNSKEVIDEWKQGKLTTLRNSKEIFELAINRNILVNIIKDSPSTADLKGSAAMLSPSCWNIVQSEFGGSEGHNLDLMSLDVNCQRDKLGSPLRHFTPFPTRDSAGVDVFCQDLSKCDGSLTNAYVYPPFYLIPKLLRYFMSQGAVVTMVVPKFSPLSSWWPLINSLALKKKCIAVPGNRNALLLPNQRGCFLPYKNTMELWAFRVDGNRGKPLLSE